MTDRQRKLKILFAHGFGQSGLYLKSQTQGLEQSLRSALAGVSSTEGYSVESYYPDGPLECIALQSINAPTSRAEQLLDHNPLSSARCWSREVDSTVSYDPMIALLEVARCIKLFGPFDGAIGFSQGGTVLSLASALLDPTRKPGEEISRYFNLFWDPELNTRIQPPFKFLASFCSPDAPGDGLRQFWDPKVAIPMLQVAGELDTYVDTVSAQGLASRFCGGATLFHRGGHFIPKDKTCIEQVVRFIVDALLGLRPSNSREPNPLQGPNESIFESRDGHSGRLVWQKLDKRRAATIPSRTWVAWRKPRGRQRGVVMVLRKHRDVSRSS